MSLEDIPADLDLNFNSNRESEASFNGNQGNSSGSTLENFLQIEMVFLVICNRLVRKNRNFQYSV